ncbi:MAG: hypothetical protein HC819_23890 [Cyclobacteriaceae bacterium]|nr:hypothetical protein [Cyclobacteriaceae bacterium]
MNLSSKQKFYKDTLLSKDFFLVKGYGYQHLSTNKDDETGKVNIVYINKAIEREAEFCFIPFNAKNEEHDLIRLNIIKDANSFINLQNYLRYKNIEGFTRVSVSTPEEYYNELRKSNPFYLINIQGDFIYQLRYFLDYIEKISNKYLKKILEGKDWEEIPFDWGPYK